MLLSLSKDVLAYLFDRLFFGDVINCLLSSRLLYFEERLWNGLLARLSGAFVGGRTEVLRVLRQGLVRDLREHKLVSVFNFEYYCEVLAVRVIPGVALGLLIHEKGTGSQGGIQAPESSTLDCADLDRFVSSPGNGRCLTSVLSISNTLEAKGWLWYSYPPAQVETVQFKYGSGGYSPTEPLKMSWFDFGVNWSTLLPWPVSFTVKEGAESVEMKHPMQALLDLPLSTTSVTLCDNDSMQRCFEMVWAEGVEGRAFSILLCQGKRLEIGFHDSIKGEGKLSFTVDAALLRRFPNLIPLTI